MNKKSLIDTNILIYAHDSDSSFFEKSYAFMKEQIVSDNVCFSNQNFIEAYRIWTQKLKRPINANQAWEIYDYYRQLGVKILYSTPKSYALLKNLALKYDIVGVHIFDAQLVATMIEFGIKRLYTVNTKDFVIFKELEVVNPFEK